MSHSPFHDNRAAGLLSRVRDDISHLRQDVGDLVNHTARHTLPRGARGLADNARQQFMAGGNYAASRLRSLSPPRQAIGVIGGAVLVGVIAAGIYVLCKSESYAARRRAEDESHDDIPV